MDRIFNVPNQKKKELTHLFNNVFTTKNLFRKATSNQQEKKREKTNLSEPWHERRSTEKKHTQNIKSDHQNKRTQHKKHAKWYYLANWSNNMSMVLLIAYVSGLLDGRTRNVFAIPVIKERMMREVQKRKKEKNIWSGDGKSAQAKLKMCINCSFVQNRAMPPRIYISFNTHIYLLQIIFIHFIWFECVLLFGRAHATDRVCACPHACYTVTIAIWCWFLFSRSSRARHRHMSLKSTIHIHMISECKPKKEEEEEKMWMGSLWAYHIIFIHLASYLNLFERLCIIQHNRHIPPWKLYGWWNLKKKDDNGKEEDDDYDNNKKRDYIKIK